MNDRWQRRHCHSGLLTSTRLTVTSRHMTFKSCTGSHLTRWTHLTAHSDLRLLCQRFVLVKYKTMLHHCDLLLLFSTCPDVWCHAGPFCPWSLGWCRHRHSSSRFLVFFISHSFLSLSTTAFYSPNSHFHSTQSFQIFHHTLK